MCFELIETIGPSGLTPRVKIGHRDSNDFNQLWFAMGTSKKILFREAIKERFTTDKTNHFKRGNELSDGFMMSSGSTFRTNVLKYAIYQGSWTFKCSSSFYWTGWAKCWNSSWYWKLAWEGLIIKRYLSSQKPRNNGVFGNGFYLSFPLINHNLIPDMHIPIPGTSHLDKIKS